MATSTSQSWSPFTSVWFGIPSAYPTESRESTVITRTSQDGKVTSPARITLSGFWSSTVTSPPGLAGSDPLALAATVLPFGGPIGRMMNYVPPLVAGRAAASGSHHR
jgi:hypothetical protein